MGRSDFHALQFGVEVPVEVSDEVTGQDIEVTVCEWWEGQEGVQTGR